MSFAERVWWLLTFGAVGWYLTVTVFVAVRGANDIRHMLKRLQERPTDAKNESSQHN